MPKNKKGRIYYCDVCQSDYVCSSKNTEEFHAYRSHKSNCKKHKEMEAAMKIVDVPNLEEIEETEVSVAKTIVSELDRRTLASTVESYGICYWSPFSSNSSNSDFGGTQEKEKGIGQMDVKEMEFEDVLSGVEPDVDENISDNGVDVLGLEQFEDNFEDDNNVPKEVGIEDGDVESVMSGIVEEQKEMNGWSNTRLLKAECKRNDILDVQLFILRNYFWKTPGNFNRVAGEEVNIEIALKMLERIEMSQMSQEEADDFLRFQQILC